VKKVFRAVTKLLNWVILPAVLLSYLAPFVSPNKAWIISFFGLSFNIWAVSLIVVLLLGLRLKTKMFVKNAIVLVIGIPFFLRLISVHPGAPEEGNFKVASFNTYALGEYNGLNTSKDIEQYLVKNHVDCAVLLEWRPKKGVIRKSAYPYQVEVRTSKLSNSGMLLVSKHPIKDSGRVPFTHSSYNMAGYMDVNVHGTMVRVYGIHLETTRIKARDFHSLKRLDFDSTYNEKAKNVVDRLKTAMQIRTWQVADIKSHVNDCPFPNIIMGDFNDTPQSFAYQQLKEGKKDAFVTAGSGYDATFLKPIPFLRIDYIMYDDAFTATNYWSSDTIYSDHKLIFADLKID
jgi:endonuclease/exonuclease/phosphatase family metal-dependent hydrolase